MNQYYRPRQFKLLPDAVKNLLIINGLMFALTVLLESKFMINLNEKLGLHYFAAHTFQPFQLITYMFMHGSFTHLLFNMFALWMFGAAMENYWGLKRFLVYYFITGIGAALTQWLVLSLEMMPLLDALNDYLEQPGHAALNELFALGKLAPESPEMQARLNEFIGQYSLAMNNDPDAALLLSQRFISDYRDLYLNAPLVVGASGAVFGLLLAYGMEFPNQIIYLYFAIPIKAKYFVILYGILELMQGIAANEQDNVAHFAHLGGMIFGIFLILHWRKRRTFF